MLLQVAAKALNTNEMEWQEDTRGDVYEDLDEVEEDGEARPCTRHTDCLSRHGVLLEYCDKKQECFHCDGCLKFKDSIDGDCPCLASREATMHDNEEYELWSNSQDDFPTTREAERSEKCSTHEDCRKSHYCNSANGCSLCASCIRLQDSYDGVCPLSCFALRGTTRELARDYYDEDEDYEEDNEEDGDLHLSLSRRGTPEDDRDYEDNEDDEDDEELFTFGRRETPEDDRDYEDDEDDEDDDEESLPFGRRETPEEDDEDDEDDDEESFTFGRRETPNDEDDDDDEPVIISIPMEQIQKDMELYNTDRGDYDDENDEDDDEDDEDDDDEDDDEEYHLHRRDTSTECSNHGDCAYLEYCDKNELCTECEVCLSLNDAIDGRCPSECIRMPLTRGVPETEEQTLPEGGRRGIVGVRGSEMLVRHARDVSDGYEENVVEMHSHGVILADDPYASVVEEDYEDEDEDYGEEYDEYYGDEVEDENEDEERARGALHRRDISTPCESHDDCAHLEYCDRDQLCSDCELCEQYENPVDGRCPSECLRPAPVDLAGSQTQDLSAEMDLVESELLGVQRRAANAPTVEVTTREFSDREATTMPPELATEALPETTEPQDLQDTTMEPEMVTSDSSTGARDEGEATTEPVNMDPEATVEVVLSDDGSGTENPTNAPTSAQTSAPPSRGSTSAPSSGCSAHSACPGLMYCDETGACVACPACFAYHNAIDGTCPSVCDYAAPRVTTTTEMPSTTSSTVEKKVLFEFDFANRFEETQTDTLASLISMLQVFLSAKYNSFVKVVDIRLEASLFTVVGESDLSIAGKIEVDITNHALGFIYVNSDGTPVLLSEKSDSFNVLLQTTVPSVSFSKQSDTQAAGMSGGAIAAIVVTSLFFVIAVILAVYLIKTRRAEYKFPPAAENIAGSRRNLVMLGEEERGPVEKDEDGQSIIREISSRIEARRSRVLDAPCNENDEERMANIRSNSVSMLRAPQQPVPEDQSLKEAFCGNAKPYEYEWDFE